MATWNINGLSLINSALRIELLKSVLPNVICLCETDLQSQKTINIDGYTFFVHNRKHTLIRMNRRSGEVAFLFI